MPDFLTLTQKVIGRLTMRRIFAFRQEIHGREGVEPDRLRDFQRLCGRLISTRLFSRVYPGVPGRVHIHDNMLMNDSPAEMEHYVKVGHSAIRNIEETLRAAGKDWKDIQSCLDMPSGCGRVLRHLASRIEPARITACEIDDEYVRFCAAEFGVRPLHSKKDFRQIQFPDTYDLIWVGSLFTHLDLEDVTALLRVYSRILRPGGLLIFSTQGETCLEFLSMYGWMFVPLESKFREAMESGGAFYAQYYPSDPKWGITLMSRPYLEKLFAEKFASEFKCVRFERRGLDDHQDVWSLQKLGA